MTGRQWPPGRLNLEPSSTAVGGIATVGSKPDAMLAFFFGHVKPVIGFVRSDVRESFVRIVANRTTKAHAGRKQPFLSDTRYYAMSIDSGKGVCAKFRGYGFLIRNPGHS